MGRFLVFFSLLLATCAQAYVSDCTGTSDQGNVELKLSNAAPDSTLAPLQGYLQADVFVNGVNVYSTPYIAYNPANQEYFTAGNSALVLSSGPDYQLYLHVWNADGTVTVPSFDTISVSCQ